jgi:hypothetical protein
MADGKREQVMNIALAKLNDELTANRQPVDAEREAMKADFAKFILQGLIMSGRINYEDPGADLIRMWKLAGKAVEAKEKA